MSVNFSFLFSECSYLDHIKFTASYQQGRKNPKLLTSQIKHFHKRFRHQDSDARRVVVATRDMPAIRIVPLREINWFGDSRLADAEIRISPVLVRSSRPPTRGHASPTLGDQEGVGVALDREGVATGKSLHLPQNQRQPGIGRRLYLAKELIAKHSDAWRKFAEYMDRYCPWE